MEYGKRVKLGALFLGERGQAVPGHVAGRVSNCLSVIRGIDRQSSSL